MYTTPKILKNWHLLHAWHGTHIRYTLFSVLCTAAPWVRHYSCAFLLIAWKPGLRRSGRRVSASGAFIVPNFTRQFKTGLILACQSGMNPGPLNLTIQSYRKAKLCRRRRDHLGVRWSLLKSITWSEARHQGKFEQKTSRLFLQKIVLRFANRKLKGLSLVVSLVEIEKNSDPP